MASKVTALTRVAAWSAGIEKAEANLARAIEEAHNAGASDSEIADAMGVSRQAVQSRRARLSRLTASPEGAPALFS